MRKTAIVVSLTIVVLLACLSGGAVADIIAPPTINVPAGGKVVMEVNLTDGDVLGVIKQSIPAVADVVREMAPAIAHQVGAPANLDIASMINLDEFSQAISGIKNVRVLVVRYPDGMTPEQFLTEFSVGVGKIGQFSKTVNTLVPTGIALFSAPNNAGIIAAAYSPNQHTAYAIRVVGGVDVPKLIHWSGQIGKYFVGMRTEVQPPAQQPAPANPAPETPTESK